MNVIDILHILLQATSNKQKAQGVGAKSLHHPFDLNVQFRS